jgi:hypothetical protein
MTTTTTATPRKTTGTVRTNNHGTQLPRHLVETTVIGLAKAPQGHEHAIGLPFSDARWAKDTEAPALQMHLLPFPTATGGRQQLGDARQSERSISKPLEISHQQHNAISWTVAPNGQLT